MDALLNKEVITDTFSQAEAVKAEIAEANTELIERIKMLSNKICMRNDLAKKNMMFSHNVELIELWRNPEFNAHHAFTTYFREQLCACGKHITSNQEMIQRVRKALS